MKSNYTEIVINSLVLLLCSILYAAAHIMLSTITVTLSAVLSIVTIYLQSEFRILEKIQQVILNLIINIFGEK